MLQRKSIDLPLYFDIFVVAVRLIRQKSVSLKAKRLNLWNYHADPFFTKCLWSSPLNNDSAEQNINAENPLSYVEAICRHGRTIFTSPWKVATQGTFWHDPRNHEVTDSFLRSRCNLYFQVLYPCLKWKFQLIINVSSV